jgi:hypothetical protein
MSTWTRMAAAVMLGVLLAAGAGCVAVAAGAAAGAGVAYVRGNAESVVSAPAARVIGSTRAVFDELRVEYRQTRQDDERSEWRVYGRGPGGESIRVTIRQLGPEASKVWVRVGTLGDRDLSVTVLERVRARL